MITWYTAPAEDAVAVERLVAAWPDAPIENAETCNFLLEIARDQVWAFAPESQDNDGAPVIVPTSAEVVPARLVMAQLKQTENLWNAGRVSSAGDVGEGGYVYTPRPLDKTIRGMIRHIQGVFSVG